MFVFPIEPTPLHLFLSERGEELQHSAFLLSGHPALRRVHDLLLDISFPREFSRRNKIAIAELFDLLSQRNEQVTYYLDGVSGSLLDPFGSEFDAFALLAEELADVATASDLSLGNDQVQAESEASV